MVVGSQEWADFFFWGGRAALAQLLFTCFKQSEDKTKEVEYRLWYIEEGRFDELVSYMRQRLFDYTGD